MGEVIGVSFGNGRRRRPRSRRRARVRASAAARRGRRWPSRAERPAGTLQLSPGPSVTTAPSTRPVRLPASTSTRSSARASTCSTPTRPPAGTRHSARASVPSVSAPVRCQRISSPVTGCSIVCRARAIAVHRSCSARVPHMGDIPRPPPRIPLARGVGCRANDPWERGFRPGGPRGGARGDRRRDRAMPSPAQRPCWRSSARPGSARARCSAATRERAAGAGLTVLEGRAAEHERDVPFGLVTDALDDTVAALHDRRLESLGPERLADLAGVLPAAAQHAESPAPAAGPAERFRYHRALVALLGLLARERPVALLLDDLHWADEGSVEFVLHLLRRPADGVLLVFALAPRGPGATAAGRPARRSGRDAAATRAALARRGAGAARRRRGRRAARAPRAGGGRQPAVPPGARARRAEAGRAAALDAPRRRPARGGGAAARLAGADRGRGRRGRPVRPRPRRRRRGPGPGRRARPAGPARRRGPRAGGRRTALSLPPPAHPPRRLRHGAGRLAARRPRARSPRRWPRAARAPRPAPSTSSTTRAPAIAPRCRCSRTRPASRSTRRPPRRRAGTTRRSPWSPRPTTSSGSACSPPARSRSRRRGSSRRAAPRSCSRSTCWATRRRSTCGCCSSPAARRSSRCSAATSEARARLLEAYEALPERAPLRARLEVQLATVAAFTLDHDELSAWAEQAVLRLGDERSALALGASAIASFAAAWRGHPERALEAVAHAERLLDQVDDGELAAYPEAPFMLSSAQLFLGRFSASAAAAERGLAVSRAFRQDRMLVPLHIFAAMARWNRAELDAGARPPRRGRGGRPAAERRLSAELDAVDARDDAAGPRRPRRHRAGAPEARALTQGLEPSITPSSGLCNLAVFDPAVSPERRLQEVVAAGGGEDLPRVDPIWATALMRDLCRAALEAGRPRGRPRWATAAQALAERLDHPLSSLRAAGARVEVLSADGERRTRRELAVRVVERRRWPRAPRWRRCSRACAPAGRSRAAGRREEAIEMLQAAVEAAGGTGAGMVRDAAAQELRRLGSRPSAAASRAGTGTGTGGAHRARARDRRARRAGTREQGGRRLACSSA